MHNTRSPVPLACHCSEHVSQYGIPASQEHSLTCYAMPSLQVFSPPLEVPPDSWPALLALPSPLPCLSSSSWPLLLAEQS